MTYDLRHEPWITCELPDGSHRSVGLAELFGRAHEITRFYHPNPLSEASLMRILLALTHRLIDGPRNKRAWKEAYEKGRFDADAINAYFEKWADRFDLFSEEHPFMQTAKLVLTDEKKRCEKEPLPLSLLVHHVTTGNNATLFDHNLDEAPVSYAPAEAVYILLNAHAYALGGIHKKSSNLFGYQQNCSHGTSVNGYQVFINGENLFESIMLNTLIYSGDKPMPVTGNDAPHWENPPVLSGEGVPGGYLDYLTFQGRNIRLVPDGDGRVTKMHFACGRSLNEAVKEPFVPTRTTKEGEKAMNFSLEKAMWRDSGALFEHQGENFSIAPLTQLGTISRELAQRKFSLSGYGIINNKASPLAYRKETLPLPLEILEEDKIRIKISAAVEASEEGQSRLRFGIKTFSEIAEANADGLKAESETVYWAQLDLPFKQQLSDVANDAYLSNWETIVQRVVNTAYEAAVEGVMADKARGLKAYVEGQKRLYFKKKGGDNQ